MHGADCPAGEYQADDGSCVVCPHDTYKPSAGSGACQACPSGTATSGGTPDDHDSASDCKPGAPAADVPDTMCYQYENCLLATLEWCWHAFVTHVLLPSPANLFCVYAVQDQKLCEQFMGPRVRSGVYNITLRGEQYQVGESCRHASHLLGACAGWLPRACVVHACCRHQHSLRSGFVRHM